MARQQTGYHDIKNQIMTKRALRKSTLLKSEEIFIHLLKSRKSHDHLATLHCSSVDQNTCILECIYFKPQLL